jgi:hypothetical protein
VTLEIQESCVLILHSTRMAISSISLGDTMKVNQRLYTARIVFASSAIILCVVLKKYASMTTNAIVGAILLLIVGLSSTYAIRIGEYESFERFDNKIYKGYSSYALAICNLIIAYCGLALIWDYLNYMISSKG